MARPQALPEPQYNKPIHENLTTLGWLKHCKAPTWKYLEWMYFEFIKE